MYSSRCGGSAERLVYRPMAFVSYVLVCPRRSNMCLFSTCWAGWKSRICAHENMRPRARQICVRTSALMGSPSQADLINRSNRAIILAYQAHVVEIVVCARAGTRLRRQILAKVVEKPARAYYLSTFGKYASEPNMRAYKYPKYAHIFFDLCGQSMYYKYCTVPGAIVPHKIRLFGCAAHLKTQPTMSRWTRLGVIWTIISNAWSLRSNHIWIDKCFCFHSIYHTLSLDGNFRNYECISPRDAIFGSFTMRIIKSLITLYVLLWWIGGNLQSTSLIPRQGLYGLAFLVSALAFTHHCLTKP
jgi:hypothetical protein